MTDSMKVAVFGCMLLVGTGGGALVGWSFGKNGPGKGPANSPVVVRGGSVSAVTASGKWWPGDTYTYWADVGKTPNAVYLDWVDKSSNPPTPVSDQFQSDTNWAITLTMRDADPSGSPPATTIQICTAPDCATTGSIPGTKIYLVGRPADRVQPDIYDSKVGHIHFVLNQCTFTAADPDPQCNHIKTLQIAGVPGYDTYRCVDGACDISIAHHN